MHKLFTYLCSALLLVTATSCEKKTEKLLLGGSGWNKIVIIDKNTKQVVATPTGISSLPMPEVRS